MSMSAVPAVRLAPVVPLRPGQEVTLRQAVAAFTATLDGKTRDQYRWTLSRFTAEAGADTPLAALTGRQIDAWLAGTWPAGEFAADTFNRALAVIQSAVSWWQYQEWLPEDEPRLHTRKRKATYDKTKVLTGNQVAGLLAMPGVSLTDRALLSVLYWTAGRAEEVLSLNWEVMDLAGRQAAVVGKGGDTDYVLWMDDTAAVLEQLREVHPSPSRGPVFLSARGGRMSYRTAARHFTELVQATDLVPGRVTLHWLRHSRLSHLGDAGYSAYVIQRVARHSSIRTSQRYVHLSAAALRRQLEHGPAGRD